MSDTELMTVEADILADLTVRREPSLVLEEARKAAVALKDVLDTKPNKVMMGEEQYLEFEDWQTVGKFYGVTCGLEDDPEHAPKIEYVQFGDIKGFKATCVALHNGKVISRATQFCLSDEEKWGERNKYAWAYCLKSGGTSVEDPGPQEIIWVPNKFKAGKSMPKKEKVMVGKESVPLYQLASMAQTRANSKVLRNVLSWVVVLAGYKPTPAEEMPGVVGLKEPAPVAPPMEAKGSVVEPPVEEILKEMQQAGDHMQFMKAREATMTPADMMQDYLTRTRLSESVRECSEVGNEAESDKNLKREDLLTIRKLVKARMVELGKK